MVDFDSLMKALPVYGLEPQTLAHISGFPGPGMIGDWKKYFSESIDFLEPPAGQHEPYVKSVDFMLRIFFYQGMDADVALDLATEQYDKLRLSLNAFERPVFYKCFFDGTDDSEYVSVVALLKHLRENKLVSLHLIDFFEKVSEIAQTAPLLDRDGNSFVHRLIDWPNSSPPKAMIEYAPVSWANSWDDDPIFWAWRDAMKPIVEYLEKELGESVYHFDDPDDDFNDECVHRFLMLHWCCTYAPDSSYVRYLMEVSGAKDVDELKAALIDPANYVHPFEMYCAYYGIEVSPYRLMTYLPPVKSKRVGVVYNTEAARPVAESIILQQIGAEVLIAATIEQSKTLCKQTMRYCQNWNGIFSYDGTIEYSISFLAHIDELYVVADGNRREGIAWDLNISDSVQELLWKAIDLKIPAHYYSIRGTRFDSPEVFLEKHGVPERVAAKDKERKEYTTALSTLLIDNDWSSSGLWSEGKMISYEYIDLPLSLVRRIIDWQEEYDETLDDITSGKGWSDEWVERHEREKREIAIELQNTLGSGIVVEIKTEQGSTPIMSVVM